MRTLIKILVVFFGVSFLVATFLGVSFVWDAFMRSPVKDASPVVITIEPGSSVKAIAEVLKDAGLIPGDFGFRLYVRITQVERTFQPGEFTLYKNLNYSSIVANLTAITPDEVTITFPEGLTIDQMAERVDTAFGSGSGAEWLKSLSEKNWSNIYVFLPSDDLQGYLFPDTYRISRSGFPDELTYKLLTNFSEKLSPELRAEISRQGKIIEEVVILASILEREVRGDADRALVADLFWRRLEIGMALQADSTVHFVVGSDGSTVYTSDTDREVNSPYNTYKYRGLPPGPISNPSLSAVMAVIYPAANNYWYFLTDSEGQVHYAQTNDEQNENKYQYLR
ncbi:MAG: Aminodeoxychorismate lyase [Candidatus Uhrbacteria bacterium GW2011_GWE2_45_35]|uniref:Endolytic murein transglycosylase n=2 Tax=Candidatus Uhriibacteriota TaxID=1752732 RepID=A0A0G1MC57_9BACT|nr:MAG: Aminodeoxychorismate lyase [Candidatus Uhrbacteria bacterium GW2011_GWF2_44_350]KKU06396.1 MAG: Aminodeoxychorismate lyase [Candidatus Uhrbacteria bacterium GW2011_GWE2_45_35]HCU31484.1 endolytic transglycosylase MltG [Candidatus Uhrbacteria bacterium]